MGPTRDMIIAISLMMAVSVVECGFGLWRLIRLRCRTLGLYAVIALSSLAILSCLAMGIGWIWGGMPIQWRLVISTLAVTTTAITILALPESYLGPWGVHAPQRDTSRKRSTFEKVTVVMRIMVVVMMVLLLLTMIHLVFDFT